MSTNYFVFFDQTKAIFCKTKCEDCKIEQSGRIIIYVMARGPVEAPNRVRSIG